MSDETVAMITTWAVKIVGVLLVFYIAWKLAGWAGRKVTAVLTKREFDKALSGFAGALVRWSLIVLAGLACLGAFGIQTASFAAVLAGAGLAIGLALQGTLSNFAAGVMLLIFRPFTIGDVVNIGGVTGKVAGIGLFSTDLDTVDNRRIIIPNGNIFGSNIENITFHDKRRVDVSVGAEYPADIDKTRQVLLDALADVEKILEDPAPQIFLSSLGGSSVDYQVRVWCATPDYWDVFQAVTRIAKKSLDSAEIGIPYQTIDVNVFQQAS